MSKNKMSSNNYNIGDFDVPNTIIGDGCFGFVKKVVHKETGHVYALKTMEIENGEIDNLNY